MRPARAPATKDTTAPTATIAGLKKRYAHGRGPRELRGTVSADPSGIKSVRLAITRRKGDRCWTFAGGRERFVRHRCGGWKSFKIGDRADWSYLLPERLGTRALHHSRGGDRQGRQRRRDAGEDPGPMKPLLLALLAGAVLAAPASAASVDVMVVGKRDVLAPAHKVALKARSATVDGRRCALGRATPLSVLAGAGVPFTVRDYGSCSRRARDAGSLYVQRIGPDAARGRDGWVYKVGNRSGSAGAADPGGSFGTGRTLRAGQRVLWFWCVKDAPRRLPAHARDDRARRRRLGPRDRPRLRRARPRQAGGGRDGPARRRHRDHRRRRRGDAGRARAAGTGSPRARAGSSPPSRRR